MFNLGNTELGTTLILLGIAFLALMPFLLRAAARLKPIAHNTVPSPNIIKPDLDPIENAVLLVQPGGRVISTNQHAREWFGLLENEQPNLERMARRTRPTESFLNLCAASGQARFTLQSILVEGFSYQVPYQNETAILITLQRPQLTGLKKSEGDTSGQTIKILTEVSQSITASLDLDVTITSILENVDQLIRSDFSEIALWHAENNEFQPYRYLIGTDGKRKLEHTTDIYRTGEGYSSFLSQHKQGLLIEDIRTFEAARPAVDRQRFPFKSYLGVPLYLGNILIGTIELTSQGVAAFNNGDLELLKVLGGYASVALQNAIIHNREQKRAQELAGLSNLTRVSTKLHETGQIYEHLTQTIADLINVEMLGLLIYNPANHTLEGKVPFLGVPSQFVEMYRVDLNNNPKAETVWYTQDVIIDEEANNSQPLIDMGLAHLAHAAGMRETVLIPLISSGRALGYMQIANKKDKTQFDNEDLRLYTIIAGQTASLLENALLVSEARRRTQRSESLRRIASLTGSSATIDEILKFSLMELHNYLQADQVALFIYDETLGELRLDQDSAIGLNDITLEAIMRLPHDEINFRQTATAHATSLLVRDLWEDTLPLVYVRLRQHLSEIRSAIIIPLTISERGIGEIFIGSGQRHFYTLNDVHGIETAIGQIASAIERATRYTQTDESLQRRVDQLTALTRVSRDLNTTINLNHLLQRVYDEALQTTESDNGTILLFDLNKSTGHERSVMLTLGTVPHQRLNPLELDTVDQGQPQIINNYQHSRYAAPSPDTKSSLLVPIAYQGDNVGLIHLHARKTDHFDQGDLEITQTLAVQAAIALGNAQRYQKQKERNELLNRRVDALDKLLETTQAIHLDMPLDEALEIIAYGIQESNLFEITMIYAYQPEYDTLKALAGVGLPLDILNQLSEVIYPWSQVQQLMRSDFKTGSTYFIPHDQRRDVQPMIPEYALLTQPQPEDVEHAWQQGDRLIVPLLDAQNNPLGVIAVDVPRNGLRPDSITTETLEIFATEASLVIESHQKMNTLQTEVQSIQAEINRSSQTGQMEVNHLSTLLQKDLEQTISIQQLHDRARNIRVGLDIAEIVNRQPDREAVLSALANQMMTQMGLDLALVAEGQDGAPRLIEQVGAVPEGANPQALLGQRNPIRQTFQSGEPIFVANLDEDPEWHNTPLLKNLDAKGFISLPITTNGHVEASVLAISHTPLASFTREDEHIYTLIGGQVSITLQNINLLTETRRRLREVNLLLEFSRQLGSLDTTEILTTLVESTRRVMANAHGGMVALWDDDQKVLVTQAASGYIDNKLITEITYLPGEALIGQAYVSGEGLQVSEVDFASQYNLSSKNLLRYREATGGRLPISCMLVPIKTNDMILGVMSLENFNTTGAFTEEDNALLSSLAQQTALTLENARLFEEARRFNEELEQRVAERTAELERQHSASRVMLQISNELSSSLDLDIVLNRSLDMLNEAMNAEQSTIVIMRPTERNLIYRAGTGIHQPPPTGGRVSTLKIGEGLAGWVIENREIAMIPDLILDERWMQDQGITSAYRSALAVPLVVGEDALGALMLYHREINQFSDDQINAVQAAANQFAVTINNGELFTLIRDQAENLGGMLRTQQIEARRSTAMLEGIADGVLVTDNSSTITLFNDSAEEILQLEGRQVVGSSLEQFIGLFGNAGREWIHTIQAWSDNPAAAKQEEIYAERIILEDGRVVSVHLAPVNTPNEFMGTVSIFRDITHQVEVDRLKSEFVATVSHELRTPMTPIKGYVEFLLMGGAGELNEQQTEFVDIIKSNVDRLSILVNDLLDVSRIEAGKVSLSFQPVNIIEAAQEAVSEVQHRSRDENRSMDIKIITPDDLPSVYGDLERIRQILSNLVDNAYRYSPDNSQVRVHLRRINGDLQIDIIDQGIGIFPDDQDLIFERFYRGENHRVMATAGTGLGLPIVRELVEMHNGRIWVESSGAPGEGSKFSFTIPIYDPNKDR